MFFHLSHEIRIHAIGNPPPQDDPVALLVFQVPLVDELCGVAEEGVLFAFSDLVGQVVEIGLLLVFYFDQLTDVLQHSSVQINLVQLLFEKPVLPQVHQEFVQNVKKLVGGSRLLQLLTS